MDKDGPVSSILFFKTAELISHIIQKKNFKYILKQKRLRAPYFLNKKKINSLTSY